MDKKIIVRVRQPKRSCFIYFYSFTSNGFRNVTILEDENWVGGRVYTVSFGANVADLGAQKIW